MAKSLAAYSRYCNEDQRHKGKHSFIIFLVSLYPIYCHIDFNTKKLIQMQKQYVHCYIYEKEALRVIFFSLPLHILLLNKVCLFSFFY
jgi:hypothetical protein